MTADVRIPSIGFSMKQGTLTEWLVADNEMVEEGQPLYVLELDKSIQEVEAPASGRLKIVAAVGETYAVGTLIAEII